MSSEHVRARRSERKGKMKRMIVVATVLVLTVVTLRRFGPTLVKRAMAKCEEMMAGRQGGAGTAPRVWVRADEATKPASISSS
jgi:hypothetical protein